MSVALRVPFMRRIRQRGAAALMTLVFLLIVVGMAVVVALKMSGSDVYDTASQQNSVQALFLAESAMERTAQRLSGTACASLGTEVPIPLGSGSSGVVAPAPYVDAGLCRVRVAGSVGSVTRTVDAWFSGSGGAIAYDNSAFTTTTGTSLNLSITVGTGSNRMMLIGVASDKGKGTVTAISFAGTSFSTTSFSAGRGWLGGAGSGGNPGIDVFGFVNPPSGTGTLTLTTSGTGSVVVGVVVYSGVDQTNPIDSSQMSISQINSANPAIALTTVASNAWVVNFIAADKGVTLTPNNPPTKLWGINVGTAISGGASGTGPYATPGVVTQSWNLPNSQKWNMGIVSLTPAGSPRIVRWSEVVQ